MIALVDQLRNNANSVIIIVGIVPGHDIVVAALLDDDGEDMLGLSLEEVLPIPDPERKFPGQRENNLLQRDQTYG